MADVNDEVRDTAHLEVVHNWTFDELVSLVIHYGGPARDCPILIEGRHVIGVKVVKVGKLVRLEVELEP
jgi:hypothetical protein